jgi:hypothetical protein
MGMFVRVTFVAAAVIVALAALVMLIKLLVVAAFIAAIAIGVALAIRFVRGRPGRLGANLRGRVTALTARR